MYDTFYLAERLYERHASEDGLFKHWISVVPLASLFRYRGLIRKLILDFKIKGHWQSGQALVEIFSEDEFVHAFIEGADFIMPVPSSLWSRFRGKHDLAYALAERLSVTSGVDLRQPPRRLAFRIKKQSFRSYSERVKSLEQGLIVDGKDRNLELKTDPKHGTNSSEPDRPLIVLVDDIVTSAKTLRRLALAMPHARYRFLTLATAYRGSPWEDEE